MKKKYTAVIVFFSTPAHGHVNPALPILSELAKRGCRVIFYGTDEFRSEAESVNAEFLGYEMGDIVFDTTVGSRLFELADLILRFTLQTIDKFISTVRDISPDMIIFDTIAFWGRAVSEITGIPSVSINALITVPFLFSKAFFMYTFRFSASSFREMKYLSSVWRSTGIIRKKYRIKETSVTDLLMNKADFNVYTYPGQLHPDKRILKENHFFLGSSSLLRKTTFSDPDEYNYKNMIYVSLGTVFNRSEKFWEMIIQSFSDSKYTVVLSSSVLSEKKEKAVFPENIIVKKYTDQRKVLKKAKLFISAGGMNSICEAAANGVPCIICPQQGEQAINAKMIQKLGLGFVLHNKKEIRKKTVQLLENYKPDEMMIREFNTIRMDELMDKLEELMGRKNNLPWKNGGSR